MHAKLRLAEIRPWAPGDAPALARHANDRDVWRNLRDAFPHPYGLEDATGFIARAPETFLCVACEGEAIGGIGLSLHQDVERFSAELGYWIARPHWGKGIATEAIAAVTAWGFEALGLQRIFAVPFAYNRASGRALEKCGYVLEGRLRSSAFKEGRFVDQLLYARLSSDRDRPPPRHALTILAVSDLPVAVAFYRAALEWAPAFRERVLHHALMAHVGPALDRTLVADTYACRSGKGTVRAIARAQYHARRYPWHVKIDVRAFFASVEHGRLLALLARRIHGPDVLALCGRILSAGARALGRGLPIGALTSQHFANAYLGPLDRFLLERLRVAGMVRYMDDAVWWCRSRDEARASLEAVRAFVGSELDLELRGDGAIQRSQAGLSFLGVRVFPGTLKLGRRRRRRYAEGRRRWEGAHARGLVDGRALQAGYASAYAMTAQAAAGAFRRAQHERVPPPDV